jgi:hypothetical protein
MHEFGSSWCFFLGWIVSLTCHTSNWKAKFEMSDVAVNQDETDQYLTTYFTSTILL